MYNDYTEYLRHGLFNSDGSKKKHKYIERIKTGAKTFRYFYDMATYNAFKKSQNETDPESAKKEAAAYRIRMSNNRAKSIAENEKYKQELVNAKLEKTREKIENRKTRAERDKFLSEKLTEEYKAKTEKNERKRIEKVTKYENVKRAEKTRRMDQMKQIQTEENRTKEEFERFADKRVIDGLKLKDSNESRNGDQTKTNPDYDRENDLTSKNCGYCSLAYIMRRFGYDVEAEWNSDGTTSVEQLSCFNDPKTGKPFGPYSATHSGIIHDAVAEYNNKKNTGKILYTDSVKNESSNFANELESIMLENIKENEFGIINVGWKLGGGHSMFFERNNGKIIVRDAQTNDIYNIETLAKSVTRVSYFRVDDLVPNENIKKYVKNRGE